MIKLNPTDHGRTIHEIEMIFDRIKSAFDGSSRKPPSDRAIDTALSIAIHDLFAVRTKRLERMLKRMSQ